MFWGDLWNRDPFFSDMLDTRRNFFNLPRIFSETEFNFTPAINIKDNTKDYQIELAVPGLSKNDFDINIDDGILTISAESKQEKEDKEEGYLRREFSYNSFSRSMALPDSVDMDKDVKAQYQDGVLKLTLLKKEAAKPKKHKNVKVA